MKRKKQLKWSDARKAKVVEHSLTHTMSETAAEYGCSIGSVCRWAKLAGVERNVDRKAQTQAATEATILTAKQHRAAAREDLAVAVANIAKAIAAADIDSVQTKELWQFSTTIEVLTKVIRLEEGESTGRQEVSHEYPDIAALSDDELAAAILREAEGITGGAAPKE